jgi:putative transposase
LEQVIIAAGHAARHCGKNYVILHVLDLYSVLARDTETGATERLAIRDLQPPAEENAVTVRPDLSLVGISDSDWNEANRRFEIIRPLLTGSERTREAVEDAAEAAGVHWTTLYRWINLYLPTGRVSSLIPVRSDGGRGKGRLPDAIEQVIANAIEKYYLSTQKPSVEGTVREIEKECRAQGLEKPSDSSVQRRIRRISEEQAVAGRRGRRAAIEKFAPHGTAPEVDWPLAETQIDHSLLDIIVVDSEHRLPIGRPWLTVLIDVFSRVILGFFVSLDPPGSIGTGLCIANAVLPKERWLARLGIDAEWPCWGLPHRIKLDNAKEFRGKMLRRAAQERGVDLQFRKVKQPEYGAYIERLIGTIASEIHLLPGTTLSSPKARGEYLSEAKAVFTIQELEQWLAHWVTAVYHHRLHRGIGRTPLALWEEGIRGTKDRPGIGLPPRITDETRLRIDFMPYVERTVQQYGVEVDNIRYWDDKLRHYIARKDPAHPGRTLKHRFHFDPRDLSVLYWLDPLTQHYAMIPYRNISHPPISIWELREAKRALDAAGRANIDENALFEALEALRKRTEEAAQKTKSARRAVERRKHHRAADKPVAPAHHTAPASSATPEETGQPELTPYDEYDPLEDIA